MGPERFAELEAEVERIDAMRHAFEPDDAKYFSSITFLT
jgi:hypothetical protein